MPSTLRRLHIGPAGIPIITKKKSTPEGVRQVAELGLDAMEIEFVRGVRMSPQLAEETRKASVENGVILTVHAPYFVNLLSNEEAKVQASIKRILDSARIGYLAGTWSVVFHPGYYGKHDPKKATEKVRAHIKEMLKQLRDEGIDVWLRPETMGGLSEYGSLEELLDAVEGLEGASITLDFAHLYARTLGKFNNYDEYSKALELIETRLGKEALKSMHMHISGMEYGPRGEKRHLTLRESLFNWVDVLKVLKDYGVTGVLICESPILEQDAILIKEALQDIIKGKEVKYEPPIRKLTEVKTEKKETKKKRTRRQKK